MYIEKIKIGNFGKLSDREFDLRQGTNILEGPNESGKSTLCEFIKFVFYGLSNKAADGEMSERARYVSWNSNSVSGSIVLNTENGRYRIERELFPHGAGYKDSLTVVDLKTNSILSEIKKPGEYFFGIPENVFVSTVYVRQSDGAYFEGADIGDAVENIFYSADESVNTAKALKKLDEARMQIKHKKNTGRGELDRLEREMEDLVLRLTDAREANAGILQAEASLRSTVLSLNKNKAECDKTSRQIRKAELGAVLEKISEKGKYANNIKRFADNKNAIINAVSYNGFLPDTEYTEALKKAKSELYYFKKSIENSENSTEEFVGYTEDSFDDSIIEKIRQSGGKNALFNNLGSLNKKKKGSKTISLVFFVIVALSLLSQVALGLFMSKVVLPLIALAAASLVTGIVFAAYSTGKNKNYKNILASFSAANEDELRQVIDKAEEAERIKCRNLEMQKMKKIEKETAESELSEYIKKQAELLAKWGRKPKDDGYKSVMECIDDALSDICEIEKELNLCDREIDKNNVVLGVLDKQLKGIDQQKVKEEYESLSGDGDIKNIDELKRRYDFYINAGEMLRTKKEELEKNLIELKAKSESPSAIDSELNYVKNRIKELSFKHTAYLLAYEKLQKAGESLRGRLAPGLASVSGELMGDITDGKYKEIGVSDSLKMTYSSEEEGSVRTRSIDCVSSGTRDIAYVSLRLALAKMFGKDGNKLPVVFDEAFARLDDTRLENMLGVVARYAKDGTQAIILTSQKREGETAKKTDMGECLNYLKI